MKPLHLVLGAVSLLLLAVLLSSTDLDAVQRTLSHARLEFVLAALCVALVSLSLRVLRWKVLLDRKKRLPFLTVLVIQAAGTAVSNLSPGKLLEPVKVLPLKKHGLDYGFALLSVFWERVFDLLVLVGFAFTAFSLFTDSLRTAMWAALIGLLLMAFLMFKYPKQVFGVVGRLPFLSFLSRLDGHDFPKRTLFASFFLTLLAWLSDAVAAWLVFSSVGLSIDYLRLASALYASTLAGVLSFLPGGVGSTEAVMVLLLSSLAQPLPTLVAAVLLTRFVLFGTGMVAGMISLSRLAQKE